MKLLTQEVATWMVQFNNQFNGHLGGRCVATWMVQFNDSRLVRCGWFVGTTATDSDLILRFQTLMV